MPPPSKSLASSSKSSKTTPTRTAARDENAASKSSPSKATPVDAASGYDEPPPRVSSPILVYANEWADADRLLRKAEDEPLPTSKAPPSLATQTGREIKKKIRKSITGGKPPLSARSTVPEAKAGTADGGARAASSATTTATPLPAGFLASFWQRMGKAKSEIKRRASFSTPKRRSAPPDLFGKTAAETPRATGSGSPSRALQPEASLLRKKGSMPAMSSVQKKGEIQEHPGTFDPATARFAVPAGKKPATSPPQQARQLAPFSGA